MDCNPQALARGKRAKIKKAKLKYAGQDEDDRELAMRLLDPAGKRKGKAEKRQAHKASLKGSNATSAAMPHRQPATPEQLAGAHWR